MASATMPICWKCERSGGNRLLRVRAKGERVPDELIPCSWIIHGQIPEGAEFIMNKRRNQKTGELYDNPCITKCPYFVGDINTEEPRGNREYITRALVCTDTGEIFGSVSQAARAIGIRPATLSYVMHEKGGWCRGLHYKFI